MVKVLLLLGVLALAACQQGPATPGPTATRPVPTSTPSIGVTFATKVPPTVAIDETTPTPLPTPTPTATATPVLYQIQEGDTLLGIAIENYTTVDEIEALNPGIVAELLQIGQSIVLPPRATPSLDLSAATPLPLQVAVESVSLYKTPVGSMWVLGEVRNEGPAPAAGVQVQVDLLGPDGEASVIVSAAVMTVAIPPGTKAPFAALVREAPSHDVQPRVAVVAGESVAQLGNYHSGLALQEHEVTIEEGSVTITGTLRNEAEVSAADISVVATLYDATGNVSGIAREVLQPSEQLAPGQAASFAMSAAPPGGVVTDYSIVLEGIIP